MGIIIMFMLLATVTPFIFLYLKRTVLAVVQSILLVGMWVYFFEVAFATAPAAFTVTWTMFYLCLIVAEVAWVMFIISLVKHPAEFNKSFQ
ncbi:hypothetical protein [Thalassobacillus pellis]|uniref:hypothetical protein n=1 Tax=Thalassobacillus pellis TaxID=748008 RepID=UPI00195F8537|nr:hypothetical protein [Thalassobacillus pellis]MBM7553850.1 small-conductance mechanosensitive channel [Thalassobacillus pellis]